MTPDQAFTIAFAFGAAYVLAELILAFYYFVNDTDFSDRNTILGHITRDNTISDPIGYFLALVFSVFGGSGIIVLIAGVAITFPILLLTITGVLGGLFGARSLVRFGKMVRKMNKAVNNHEHNGSDGKVKEEYHVKWPESDREWTKFRD